MLIMKAKGNDLIIRSKNEVESRIEGIAWGLFFVWVGTAFIAELSDSIGLLGVGIITLGAQVTRYFYGLPLEGFWLVVGTGFVLGGLWEYINPGVALVPVLLIMAGILLLYSVWRKSMSRVDTNSER